MMNSGQGPGSDTSPPATVTSPEETVTSPQSRESSTGTPRGALNRSAHFKVLGILGEGAQSRVYRVRTQGSHLDRALKLVDPKIVARGGWIGLEIAELFDHPNIVAVLSSGVLDPDRIEGAVAAGPYVLYEIIEGRTLEEAIGSSPLPIEQAIAFAFDILGGLSRCHAARVVHCDLKPANVLIAADNVAKVADFGLGRFADPPSPAGTFPFMATPAYAAPEQIDGTGVTPATDVYGFGAVLFRMLTGRIVFPASKLEEMLRFQQEKVPPPPSSLAPAVPPALDSYVLRCLAKDPSARFPSGKEAREALEVIAGSLSLPRPLEATRTPRPAVVTDWPTGVRLAAPRILLGGLVMGSPWAFAGCLVMWPTQPIPLPLIATAWLVMAAVLESRAAMRESSRAAESSLLSQEGWISRAARWSAGMFLAGLVSSLMEVTPESLLGLFHPGLFLLFFAALLISGPAAIRLVEEAFETRRTSIHPRVRFEGRPGTRVGIDGSSGRNLPFEIDLPAGGHELVAEQSGVTGRFQLRLPVEDYLVVHIPDARTTRRTRAPLLSPPPARTFSAPVALLVTGLVLGPFLAAGIATASWYATPAQRPLVVTWPGVRPEPEVEREIPDLREDDEVLDDLEPGGTTAGPARAQKQYAHLMDSAASHARQRAWSLALESLERARALRPTPRVFLGIAAAQHHLGLGEEARSSLAKIPMEARRHPAVLEREVALLIELDEPSAALESLASLCRSRPGDLFLRQSCCLALVKNRRTAEASELFLETAVSMMRLRSLVEASAPPPDPRRAKSTDTSLGWALGVVEQVLRDPGQRTEGMARGLLDLGAWLHEQRSRTKSACRIARALEASGLHHEELTRARARWCPDASSP